ncbi:hypothetical protein BZL30_6836 [Mycobacterium kansasii]|uniref:Uncharacterized protein n=1 Tax=Mycobacterium kansasii TaxID=1768 RepID=A0A1V3WPX5_MYCKA|nr:hypothetical protein BZL30_6836 [Mycobacterium kansasii]
MVRSGRFGADPDGRRQRWRAPTQYVPGRRARRGGAVSTKR